MNTLLIRIECSVYDIYKNLNWLRIKTSAFFRLEGGTVGKRGMANFWIYLLYTTCTLASLCLVEGILWGWRKERWWEKKGPTCVTAFALPRSDRFWSWVSRGYFVLFGESCCCSSSNTTLLQLAATYSFLHSQKSSAYPLGSFHRVLCPFRKPY